jgi:formylglycine-generating enzyme required for sulfatase activity
MFDVMPLPLDWPVEVNYHQGRAFCAWKGCGFRLPTEAERNVMKGKKVAILH